jgi:hypothetical protein
MRSPYEDGDPDGHHHQIHIDQFQMVCVRQSDGKCDYIHFAAGSIDHYKQALPWVAGRVLNTVLPKPSAAEMQGKVPKFE